MEVEVQQTPKFIDFVHSFRGFAMLNILALHAIVWSLMTRDYFNPDVQSPLFLLNETLFHASTIYFALISGLLYSLVLRNKGFKTFFDAKARNVLAPYIFCTAVFSWFTAAWGWQTSSFMEAGPIFEEPGVYPQMFLIKLVGGWAQLQYWYIPCLLVLFVLTPLLDWIVFKAPRVLVWSVILMPLVVSRPLFNPEVGFLTIPAIFYFMGAYTLGMMLGKNLFASLDFFRAHIRWLIGVTVLASLGAWICLKYYKVNFGILVPMESFFYVQKIALSILVLLFLQSHTGNLHRWLKPYADNAFAFYFLHLFFLALLMFPGAAILKPIAESQWLYLLVGFAYFALTVMACFATIRCVKAMLGRKSRYFIGS